MQANADPLTFGRDAPTPPRALARVVVRNAVAEALPDWEALVEKAPCSPYQTPAWLVPWIETLGTGIEPAFAFGYDDQGRVLVLLPLGLERRAGLTAARFLGGRDANTGLGLFAPEAILDTEAVALLLREAARLAGIDLYLLCHQPHAWAGRANPLAQLPLEMSPSHQHEADLNGSPERYFAATVSKRARKSIRQKEAKLAAFGPVRHTIATTPETAATMAEALTTHRAERHGSEARRHALRRFLGRASLPAAPAVELHGLFCGDHLVAALAGTAHRERFSAMMMAFDPDPRWARHSPGELLLARVVAQKCGAGLEIFDLGVGDARYKTTFCPRAEPLFDTILGITRRGRVAAPFARAHLRLKRLIKRTPWAWTLLGRARTALTRLSGGFPLRDRL